MSIPIVYLNRDLSRLLPLLSSDEAKLLLALMLQANAAGYLRTTASAIASWIGEPATVAAELLERLRRRRMIHVRQTKVALLVLVRGCLGGRGVPSDVFVGARGRSEGTYGGSEVGSVQRSSFTDERTKNSLKENF